MPLLGDGDGKVVWEKGAPDEGMKQSGDTENSHHGRGHEGEGHHKAFAYERTLVLGVLDGRDGHGRHREGVRPPCHGESAGGKEDKNMNKLIWLI